MTNAVTYETRRDQHFNGIEFAADALATKTILTRKSDGASRYVRGKAEAAFWANFTAGAFKSFGADATVAEYFA